MKASSLCAVAPFFLCRTGKKLKAFLKLYRPDGIVNDRSSGKFQKDPGKKENADAQEN